MPRSQPTPPAFDQLNTATDTFAQVAVDTPLAASNSIQDVILNSFWGTLLWALLLFALVVAVISIYAMVRVSQIRKAEKEFYAQQPLSAAARQTFNIIDASEGAADAGRWRDVVRHADSDNPNDWRQAILEADVMLDDAVTSRGYTGESLGEKMKQITPGDLNTIDKAWEAHKIRNRIAHEGTNYELSKREVRLAISMYERVLTELGHI